MATYGVNYRSNNTNNAKAKMEQYSPENYTSKYDVSGALDKYLNYGDFTYDQNTDALYQDYKDRYTKLGKQSMKDTMAEATSLTGGYGNSYATAAGQQSYNTYMDALADKGLELRNQAYSEWQNGKSDLLNNYSVMAQQDATDRSNWNADRDYYANLYSQYYNEDQNLISNSMAANSASSSLFSGAWSAYSEGGEGGLNAYLADVEAKYGTETAQYVADQVVSNIDSYGKDDAWYYNKYKELTNPNGKHTKLYQKYATAVSNGDKAYLRKAYSNGWISYEELSAAEYIIDKNAGNTKTVTTSYDKNGNETKTTTTR